MARGCGIPLMVGFALAASSAWGDTSGDPRQLPSRGICAHRGASDTHPENTLAALHEAVHLGAHMIEFDVARTRDGKLVLMHDRKVDRTTDGRGAVADLTLAELKKLDAGSWKNPAFQGERIPTLDEALAVVPENIWLNVHLKGDTALAEEVARRIVAHDRLHQAFLACGAEAARAARKVDPRVKICNMDRPPSTPQYADETIDMRADFIQLLARYPLDPAAIQSLRSHNVRINFCCASDTDSLRRLFEAGVEFVLVDNVEEMLQSAQRLGIQRLQPVDREFVAQDEGE